MTWQEWVQQNLPPGTKETSGYRTPQQEAALGGPASSYHTRGTPSAPGAIDVGGPAAALKQLFDEIKAAFAGRINELYLNIPGGQSEDIKANRPLGHNPEAGRAQHLHIALQPTVAPAGGFQGAATTGGPGTAGGQSAGGTECARAFCPPTAASIAYNALPAWLRGEAPEQHCVCWSDVWVYGAGLFLVVSGSWLVFRGAGK